MSARKVKRPNARQAGEALRQHYVRELEYKAGKLNKENSDLAVTLANSTQDLKQMCDLCDKQRAQIGAQHAEITHLNALIRLLVRGASA